MPGERRDPRSVRAWPRRRAGSRRDRAPPHRPVAPAASSSARVAGAYAPTVRADLQLLRRTHPRERSSRAGRTPPGCPVPGVVASETIRDLRLPGRPTAVADDLGQIPAHLAAHDQRRRGDPIEQRPGVDRLPLAIAGRIEAIDQPPSRSTTPAPPRCASRAGSAIVSRGSSRNDCARGLPASDRGARCAGRPA